jgi:hypothetical protein
VVYDSGKLLQEFPDMLGPFQLHMERFLQVLATMAFFQVPQ